MSEEINNRIEELDTKIDHIGMIVSWIGFMVTLQFVHWLSTFFTS